VSDFQNDVASTLKIILGRLPILQEVSCQRLFQEFPSHRERYDIVIPSLKIIIECHGEHHERIVTYGGRSLEESTFQHGHTKIRDRQKKEVAETSGWRYLALYRSKMPKDRDKWVPIISDALTEAMNRKEGGDLEE
jgi:very-short-patch-repair endonuclease